VGCGIGQILERGYRSRSEADVAERRSQAIEIDVGAAPSPHPRGGERLEGLESARSLDEQSEHRDPGGPFGRSWSPEAGESPIPDGQTIGGIKEDRAERRRKYIVPKSRFDHKTIIIEQIWLIS